MNRWRYECPICQTELVKGDRWHIEQAVGTHWRLAHRGLTPVKPEFEKQEANG